MSNQNAVQMAEPTRRDERVSAYLTPQMKMQLQQVLNTRPREVSMSDLLCEALELFLNTQEDQIGSRQHFNRTLKLRIDQLETRLTNYLNLIVFMEAQGFAQMVQSLTGDSSRVQAGYFIKIGVEGMARDGDKLTNQLRQIERELAAGDEEAGDGTS